MAVLRKVALQRTDLPSGYSGNVMAQGDVVAGQVTLDMCGATFASEALRTTRNQVAFRPSTPSRLPVSNEVVAYSHSGAALALTEIRHAAAHCPKGPVASKVAAMPPTVQRVTVLPSSKILPVSSIRLAITATDLKTGRHFGMEMVYTVRGRVLSGIYVDGLGTAPAAFAVRMATIVQTRLEKTVPAS